MNEKAKEVLKKTVEGILEVEQGTAVAVSNPRYVLMTALGMIKGGMVKNYSYAEWWETFKEILKELEIEELPGSEKQISSIMKEAVKADYRHRKMLGKDY